MSRPSKVAELAKLRAWIRAGGSMVWSTGREWDRRVSASLDGDGGASASATDYSRGPDLDQHTIFASSEHGADAALCELVRAMEAAGGWFD